MKKELRLALMSLLLVIAILGCSNGPTTTTTTPSTTHLYISGEVGPDSTNTFPVYWKDGALNFLPLSAGFTNGWASRMTEDSQGNIYVVGGQSNASSTIYGYWAKSIFVTLPTGGNSVVWDYALAVDASGNVWVGGEVGNSNPPSTPVCWKNGGSPVVLASASPSGIGSVGTDASGNTYFLGAEGTSSSDFAPYYWENGGTTPTVLPLTTAYANGYALGSALDTSGSFYICGGEWSYGTLREEPVYWKAAGGTWGAPIQLPKGAFSSNGNCEVRGMAADSWGISTSMQTQASLPQQS